MSKRFAMLFEALTAIAAVATLPVGILAAIFLGFTEAAVVFVVGWLLLVPVFAILSNVITGPGPPAFVQQRMNDATQTKATDDSNESDDENPLELLRDRYARGEIDEEEFERRVERLVATEEIPPGAISDSEPGSTDDVARNADPEIEVEREG